MKKHLLQFIFIEMILVVANIAFAINPVELLPKTPPPPPDTVQVTIHLGVFSCESLGCNYWEVTVYTSGGSGGNQTVFGPFTYTGWDTYTIPWSNADPTAKKICVFWHFVYFPPPACSPILSDKTCCVTYNGSGHYNFTCDPCN